MHETITFLLVTLPNIHRFKNNFTHTVSNKPFFNLVIKNFTTHFKYVATPRCNLSLMACLADINVSQGSAATYARCDGIVNSRLTANLPRNLSVNFFKSVKISQKYGLWPRFLWPTL